MTNNVHPVFGLGDVYKRMIDVAQIMKALKPRQVTFVARFLYDESEGYYDELQAGEEFSLDYTWARFIELPRSTEVIAFQLVSFQGREQMIDKINFEVCEILQFFREDGLVFLPGSEVEVKSWTGPSTFENMRFVGPQVKNGTALYENEKQTLALALEEEDDLDLENKLVFSRRMAAKIQKDKRGGERRGRGGRGGGRGGRGSNSKERARIQQSTFKQKKMKPVTDDGEQILVQL
ncbi:hypothetical protein ABW20_dc0107640 [Dactylellina cionopaga]|nr:hypothetical protein ABW20_dc0107640 [Dactylellina cionopaga]